MTHSAPSLDTIASEQDAFERARDAFAKKPRQMTMILARELNVPEATIVRAMPEGMSTELNAERWEEILGSFEAMGEVHVIVSNASVTIESVGAFGGFSKAGGFFNVQGNGLDMHIRHTQLHSVFAVRKPSHLDGHDTLSVQFFDARGTAAFKVFLTFGGSDPSGERELQFSSLVEKFALS